VKVQLQQGTGLDVSRVTEAQSTGALDRITATASDGTDHYYVLDSDSNPKNNIAPMKGIDELRQRCADFGLRAIRLTSAKQVHTILRPMLLKAGYNLRRPSGVPLGIDVSSANQYEALDDAGVPVTAIFNELHAKYGYHGDHKGDQTGGRQHLAGLGWGRSNTDVGIEDWGFQHPMQAIICSDQRPEPAVPNLRGCNDISPSNRSRSVCDGDTLYEIWDNDHNPKNNLLPLKQGMLTLRQRCASRNLYPVRITNASQVDDVLRPLLQRAGYNLQRGAGVPLGMDYNRRNTYEALDDASVGVGQIFQDLHSQRGYTGDHKSDQTGEKQNLAGFGWGTTARGKQNVGIEDWGFQRTWQQYCSRTRTTNRSIFMSVYCLGNTAFA
jgi:hypothetical protein